MTQILIYQCNRGIALATDSKAVTFIPDEQKDGLIVQKIFTLSPNVMLVTAGAGYGILLCKQFQSTVKSSGIVKFDEIPAEYKALVIQAAEECGAEAIELEGE